MTNLTRMKIVQWASLFTLCLNLAVTIIVSLTITQLPIVMTLVILSLVLTTALLGAVTILITLMEIDGTGSSMAFDHH